MRSFVIPCRRAALLIALVAAARAQSAPVVASGDQRFHFTEKPGPYAVGLKVVEQYDFSRTFRSLTDELGKPYLGERARPRLGLPLFRGGQSRPGARSRVADVRSK